MKQKANRVAWIVVASVSISLIGLLNYFLKGADHVKTWMDLSSKFPQQSWGISRWIKQNML